MTAAAQPDDRRVVLIDLSSLWWSAWHATADQSLSEAAKLTMNGIRRCYTDGDLVAVCCDSGRSFRKDISAEYKANRPEKDQNALGELARLKERLAKDGYLLWGADGYEADDVIATAVHIAPREHKILICSADKDLLQLVNEDVRVLRTHSWVEGGEAEVVAKLGVPPSRVVDWLALVGDKSDNIKGAPGIGEKTAAALLAKESLLDLYKRLYGGNRTGLTARQVSILMDNAEQIELARELVTLKTDAPIKWFEIYEERKPKSLLKEKPKMDNPFDDIPLGDGAADVPESAQMSNTVATNTEGVTASQKEAPVTVKSGELGKALAVVAPVEVEYHRALEPRSFSQALTCAQYLYDSRLYQKFQSPEAIAAVIMRGRELGLGAGTALDSFHVIEGRPYPYAYLLIALARKHADCEYLYCVEADATHAIWETKNRRNPGPTRVCFTMEQARIAGLPKQGDKGGNGWIKNPEDMCVKAAGAKLARREYSDAFLGLVSAEEMGIE